MLKGASDQDQETPRHGGVLAFESGVSDPTEVSENVDGNEERGACLSVCVLGSGVLERLGCKADCDPSKLFGIFARRG